jgi:hypothetical protein
MVAQTRTSADWLGMAEEVCNKSREFGWQRARLECNGEYRR